MNFDIIDIWERLYKKVIILSVIVITILSVNWYLNLKDKSDTFIISTLYALFLFGIGIYMNYKGNKINKKFYDRKDYYLILSRLKSVFKTMNLENYSDEDVFRAIISFKTFTSRTNGMKDVQAYVPEQGFKFKHKELNLEDDFIERRNTLLEKLRINIIDYIDKKSINKKYTYPQINNIYFEAREWCSEYCNLNRDELENMETYIYDLFSELQNEMDELECLMGKITKLYSSYREKVEWNMKTIECIYGKRLEYEFYKEDKYINEIRALRDIVENVNNNMCSNNEYEELSSNISELRQDIISLYEKIEYVEDNLTIEIDTAKNELLSDH
ncbi:hypothetical protein [Clostridium sp.]|jgi:hypothetical protein|uniref:hypothetical protein n=1 Tax=Clostridium sp. TaxID=1506 RepID=UPI003EEDAD79